MNIIRRVSFGSKSNNVVFSEWSTKLRQETWSKELRRTLIGKTYEGDGKTTASIINKKGAKTISISTIYETGFMLSNGWYIGGPTIFFPHTFLSWKVKGPDDVTEESLSLFKVLEPKLDVLFIGYGSTQSVSHKSLKSLLILKKKINLNIEVMATSDAAATFNFCSADLRYVAAALIPPQTIVIQHGIRPENKNTLLIEEGMEK